jgi:hypothetical protein
MPRAGRRAVLERYREEIDAPLLHPPDQRGVIEQQRRISFDDSEGLVRAGCRLALLAHLVSPSHRIRR